MNDRPVADRHGNQKRRTRAAIMAAAVELLRQGATPTVAEVADAALVSRATAYRYFPSQEALLAEAQILIVAREADARIDAAAETLGDAATRVEAVVQADHAMTVAHEPAFRAMLRASLEPRPDDPGVTPRRRAGRLRWFNTALAPLQIHLADQQFWRLVAALSLCVGTESLIVQRDLCGLDPAEAEAVKRWAARALVAAALAEAGATSGDDDERLTPHRARPAGDGTRPAAG